MPHLPTPNGASKSIACPACGHNESRVKDSRPDDSALLGTRRRRECTACGERYTTYEVHGGRHRDEAMLEKLKRDTLLNRMSILRSALDDLIQELAAK